MFLYRVQSLVKVVEFMAINSLVIFLLQETQLLMWGLLALHIMKFIPLQI